MGFVEKLTTYLNNRNRELWFYCTKGTNPLMFSYVKYLYWLENLDLIDIL